jgi:hypothetical protein
MRKPILLLALLCPAGVSGLAAQGTYYARLGAIGASNLLRDVIVDEITVKQSIAPMLALGGALPLGERGYRIGLEGTFASGKFHSSESGTDTDLGTVRTGTVMLWQAGLGGIKYWPSGDDGIFREGGPLKFLAGAGVDYRRPMMAKWDLLTSLRYDWHRFSTDELEQRGFSQTQGVSRVSLSIGLSRGTSR